MTTQIKGYPFEVLLASQSSNVVLADHVKSPRLASVEGEAKKQDFGRGIGGSARQTSRADLTAGV
jgi:hypothetical protein